MNYSSSVKIFVLLTILLDGIFLHNLFSQDIKILNSTEDTQSRTLIDNGTSTENISIIKTEESMKQAMYERKLYEFQFNTFNKPVRNETYKLDLVSSFRGNIRYGGFWDKYAIINFTPEMYIKPFDFLSIYAIRSMSFWVPIDGIKQNFKSMALRSAAIMAADNTVKLFLLNEKVIGPVVSFVLKNIMLYMINRAEEDSDSKNNLKNYDNHYYSISIRF